MWSVVPENDGKIRGEALPDGLTDEDLVRMYRTMSLVRTIDERMVVLQRQGRISFYGSATGQEGAVIGSGYALDARDWVLPALREGGIALLRGFTLTDYINQVFGNGEDVQLGRQMPCHYGHKDINYVTLSSCIANQLPHAVGVALAMRLKGKKTIAVGYMGDGATSEADFHTSMEFAARLGAPTMFFCQNNQWAISTGWKQQTAAPSLAIRAHGYGMEGYRVDGNDILAVYEVTRYCRERILATGRPIFIEALTYRIGAHSTSDDPGRYRDEGITEQWKLRDPIARLRAVLEARELWSQTQEQAMRTEYIANIKAEIVRAEAAPSPGLDSLFTDVYADPPATLAAQRAWLA